MDLDQILNIVSDCTDTTPEEMKSRSRSRKLSESRFLFFFFSIYLTDKTYREIGKKLNRKHNTVIYGANKAAQLKILYRDFYLKFKSINNKLN